MKDYIAAITLERFHFHKFVETVRDLKIGYVVVHFLIVSLLLNLPVFYAIVKTEPHALYARLYNFTYDSDVSLHDYGIILDNYKDQKIEPDGERPGILVAPTLTEADFESLDKYAVWFCFSKDIVAFVSGASSFAVSADVFTTHSLNTLSFADIYNDIAVYNGFFSGFLLPVLSGAFFILLVLQFAFYLILAALLGVYRMLSSRMPFGLRIKVLILCSTLPVIGSVVIGIFMPTLHIIIFELIAISLAFAISRKYDKKEKELFLCEDTNAG